MSYCCRYPISSHQFCREYDCLVQFTPNEDKDITVDGTCFLLNIDEELTDSISTIEWIIEPEGPTLHDDYVDGVYFGTWVSGLKGAQLYTLRWIMTTTEGRKHERAIALTCIDYANYS